MSVASLSRITVGVLALIIAVGPVGAQQQGAPRVPRGVLERYVGEYVYPDGKASFTVSVSGDTLFQEGGGRKVPYVAMSPTLFRLGQFFTAEFQIDQAGGATQILSNGHSIEYRLRRKGSPPEVVAPRAAVAAVPVPRSVLERYVGTYEFIPGQMERTDLRIIIRLEGNTLIREGGGPTARLTPMSETRFKVGDTSFVAEFVIDEAGVTHIMGSGFQQMLARLTSKP